MNDTIAFCPQCKNEVTFERKSGRGICPVCGFQYRVSDESPGARSGPLSLVGQILTDIAYVVAFIAGLVALVIGIVFAGCLFGAFR